MKRVTIQQLPNNQSYKIQAMPKDDLSLITRFVTWDVGAKFRGETGHCGLP